MNISLTPRLEEIVKKKVASGLYTSASEVIREALRLLDDQETNVKLERLRKHLAQGEIQLDRGEGTDGEAFFEEIHPLPKSQKRPTKYP